jgi:hypothetical protein
MFPESANQRYERQGLTRGLEYCTVMRRCLFAIVCDKLSCCHTSVSTQLIDVQTQFPIDVREDLDV